MFQPENMTQIIFGSILMAVGIIIFLGSSKLKDRGKTFFSKNDLKCGLLFTGSILALLGLHVILEY